MDRFTLPFSFTPTLTLTVWPSPDSHARRSHNVFAISEICTSPLPRPQSNKGTESRYTVTLPSNIAHFKLHETFFPPQIQFLNTRRRGTGSPVFHAGSSSHVIKYLFPGFTNQLMRAMAPIVSGSPACSFGTERRILWPLRPPAPSLVPHFWILQPGLHRQG
jgi:hypothetical protein